MIRSAVITGIGPVSAIGRGVDEFWHALLEGRSGTRRLSRCAAPRRGCAVAAEVDQPAPVPLDPAHPQPRAVQLALDAARLALDDAAFAGDRERIGVVVGSGVGNLDLIEAAFDQVGRGNRLSPAVAFRVFGHAAACEIVRTFDLRGPVATVTTGCNSGADALGLALDWIRLGRADMVLVGGTEAELTPTFMAMMGAARALAVRYNDRPEEASRPYDSGRDGNVPGEGAGFLVIESREHAVRRGARIRAELCGYASRSVGAREQYDPFNPVCNPEPIVRTLRAALSDAGIDAREISVVSANASASAFYDVVESAALKELIGERLESVTVHSIKGGLGQTGAVTPALQAIAATLSVQHGRVPPTRNAEDTDPRCIALHRGFALVRPVQYVLSNAIGFGGFYFSAFVIGRRRT